MNELRDFVLGYFQQRGAAIEPVAYGFYDVLLPDELATQLDAPALQRLAFDEAFETESLTMGTGIDPVTRLHYGHPLVESLAQVAHQTPACAHLHINTIRLDKHSIAEPARRALGFPNARLVEIPDEKVLPRLCHYVCFNFKAALVTDEKHEQLVSAVMNAQTGQAVTDFSQIERRTVLEAQSSFPFTEPLSPAWRPDAPPLSNPVLAELLRRATSAARDTLAPALEALTRRAARHLELDRARLTQYYEEVRQDLERRRARAADETRRSALKDKLAAAQEEAQAKLADIETKYRPRLELELINLMVIAQPKVTLFVHIESRTAQITRTVVWDPLLQQIEPLACDACGNAGARLFLCNGGHLAHEECLLPSCVDCKRAHCRRCTSLMSTCVVCRQPVCVQSLNDCSTCGRGTCRAHVNLCHAAEGQPVQLTPITSQPTPVTAPPVTLEPKPELQPESKSKPHPKPERPKKRSTRPTAPASAQRNSETALSSERSKPASHWRIEVFVESGVPVVTAVVRTTGQKEQAVRTWELVQDGIALSCACEKPFCPANGRLLKPELAAGIETQLETEITRLQEEYRVPPQRVSVHVVLQSRPRVLPRLVLHGRWKDNAALAAARDAFQQTWAAQNPQVHSPARLPAFARELSEEDRRDLERFTHIAQGLLIFEGALPREELMARTAEIAQPGAWYTPERAAALLKSDWSFKTSRGGLVSLAEGVKAPSQLMEKKSARGLPPRAFTAEELLTTADPVAPLSEREARIERELHRLLSRHLSVRSLRSAIQQSDSLREWLAELMPELGSLSKKSAERLTELLAELWNHTPRYELRGRTPAEVEGSSSDGS